MSMRNSESLVSTKLNSMSNEHATKWSAVYERGAIDGRKLASQQVYSKGEADVWIIVATCLFTLCTIAIIFMRKAKVSLEQIELIRQDATALMQIKEKELVAEQAQVRHLQCLHQEYISKCQKQLTLINSLREKRSALLQMVSEENTKLHSKCRTVSCLRHEKRLKYRLYHTTDGTRRRLKHTLMHTMHLMTGTVFCSTMWLSYSIGYLMG